MRLREKSCQPLPEAAAPPGVPEAAAPVEIEKPSVVLTSREMEVLQLIAEGFANKQIAGELGLSVKTVEKHRQSVMKKLDIHDIAGLVHHAVKKGIIELNAAGVPAAT
jgi:DNA-binding NarL/FixJ family response regulator